MDWSYANIWRALAAEHGDRVAIVCGDRQLTYEALDSRATRLAVALERRGLTAGDTIALALINRPEYLEAFYAALKVGCIPVNVNYRYVASELRYLLDDADAKAVVFGRELADGLKAAVTDSDPLMVEVGDRAPTLRGAVAYETLLNGIDDGLEPRHEPTGDDLITIYTGGTTGMPKGVEWRNDDLYVSLWQMRKPGSEPPDPVEWCRAGGVAPTCLPASPLMHGTALWISLTTLAGGGTVVLVENPGLDPERVWDAVSAHEVELLSIVGDAYARPLLEMLDQWPGRWDLSSLNAVMSSGVVFSPENKRRFIEHAPQLQVIDTLGSTEGAITRSVVSAAEEPSAVVSGSFLPRDGVRVISEETGTDIVPGTGEVGLLAVGGRLPLGYHNDPEKTERTFREIDGRRYAVAGDYATVHADGTIRLLGRGSASINTGGEKVFAEEVEMVFREHPDVADCAIVGVPHERWGEMVVGLVQLREGATATLDDLDEYARSRMAGYKRPKELILLDQLPRSPAGKVDYPALRDQALAALS